MVLREKYHIIQHNSTLDVLTKRFCDPTVLEKRNMDKYNCEKDKLCLSEEYLDR